jgi:hypothetical protein
MGLLENKRFFCRQYNLWNGQYNIEDNANTTILITYLVREFANSAPVIPSQYLRVIIVNEEPSRYHRLASWITLSLAILLGAQLVSALQTTLRAK